MGKPSGVTRSGDGTLEVKVAAKITGAALESYVKELREIDRCTSVRQGIAAN